MRPGKVIDRLPEITADLLDIAEMTPEQAASIYVSYSDAQITEVRTDGRRLSTASIDIVNGKVQNAQEYRSDLRQLEELHVTLQTDTFFGMPPEIAIWDARDESLGALTRIIDSVSELQGLERFKIGYYINRLAKNAIIVTTEIVHDTDLEDHIVKHIGSYEDLKPFTHRALRKRIKQIKAGRPELATTG